MTDAQHGQVAATAAEVYDEFFVPALFGQWADPVLAAAGVGPGHRVIDVGCGTGVVARAALPLVGPTGRVTGLDLNAGMLTVARRRAPGVDWREGAAEQLPFADAAFDRAVCQFALMFLRDRTAALREMARVLTPGGRIVVATWAAADRSPGYAAMIDLLDRIVGPEAGDALRAPFALGAEADVYRLVAGAVPDAEVRVEAHDGMARFASIEAWVHTDIRGWTLADAVDDDTYARLLAGAETALDGFTDDDGRVAFPAPALLTTVRLPDG